MNFEPHFTNVENLRSGISSLRKRPRRFAVAVLLVLSALGLTAGVKWALGSGAAVLFAAAVAGSTALFGLASGLCAAGVAFLALNYFFLDPPFQFAWTAQAFRCAFGLGSLAALTHGVERYVSARVHARQKSLLGMLGYKPPLGMQGHLDGLEDGVVSGWALDADHPLEPVTVSIFVNDWTVAEVAAVHHRPDVAETMGGSGAHGFYVDVREHLSDSAEVLIDACYPNGHRLPNAPYILKNSANLNARPKTVLFMHIPKTAGTAFREAIAANFRLSEIAYIYPTAPGFLVSDLRALPWKQRRSYRVVIGHFQYGMHLALPQDSEYVTIVREPSARVLSQYAFLAEWQRELVTDKHGDLIPLEQVLASRRSVDFDNTIVRCFSGVDQTIYPPGTLTSEIYQTAVHNLHTTFTFVGHQESASDAYTWLCQHFGWHAVPGLPLVNRADTNRHGISVPPATLDSIRHYNHWDFQLYEEICRLFPPRLPSVVT